MKQLALPMVLFGATACGNLLGLDDLTFVDGGSGSVSTAGTGGMPSSSSQSGAGGARAPAFPSTPVLANFDTNDGPLSSPTWLLEKAGAYAVNNFQLVTTMNEPGAAILNTVFSAAQEAYVKLAGFSASDGEVELLLVHQGSLASECEGIQVVYHPSLHQLLVSYCHQQMFSIVGQIDNMDLPGGAQFGARAFPDGKVEVYENGLLLGSYDTSAWALHMASTQDGGTIGIYCGGLTSAAVFDDFGGGTF
jgi:hypothetical protein